MLQKGSKKHSLSIKRFQRNYRTERRLSGIHNFQSDQEGGSSVLGNEVASRLTYQDESLDENEPTNQDGANQDGTHAPISTIAQIVSTLDGFESNQNSLTNAGDSIQSNRPTREELLANASTSRKKQRKQTDIAEALQYLTSLQDDLLVKDHIADP
jgi:hypothetical protein